MQPTVKVSGDFSLLLFDREATVYWHYGNSFTSFAECFEIKIKELIALPMCKDLLVKYLLYRAVISLREVSRAHNGLGTVCENIT